MKGHNSNNSNSHEMKAKSRQHGNIILVFATTFVCIYTLYNVLLTNLKGFLSLSPPPQPGSTRKASKGGEVCEILRNGLPNGVPRTDTLWADHLEQILDASLLSPADSPDFMRDFTAQLLRLMTPDRLRRSVMTTPRGGQAEESVQRVVDVLSARYEYLRDEKKYMEQHPDQIDSPPEQLKILVLGGSVTLGKLCPFFNNQRLGGTEAWECSWPNRLESFIAKLTGMEELVKVINVARGGTITEFATKVFFKYGILRKRNMWNPDVIINAYATNDIIRFSSNQDGLHKMVEDFIRTILGPSSSRAGWADVAAAPPLLIHYDDYMGDRPEEILALMESSQVFALLSEYYGIGSISYGGGVRDLVYGDTAESWLSPVWMYADPGNTSAYWHGQIHPEIGNYIVSTWMIAYYFLDTLTNHCADRDINLLWSPVSSQEGGDGRGGIFLEPYNASKIPGRPKAPPTKALAPPLNAELRLNDVAERWRESESEVMSKEDSGAASGTTETPQNPHECSAAWMPGVRNHEMELDRHIKEWGGWSFESDHDKEGYSPTQSGDTMIMKLLGQGDRQEPIRNFVLMYMKSYGEKWEGSKLAVTLQHKYYGNNTTWNQLKYFELDGSHNKTTSTGFIEDIELPETIWPKDELSIRYKFIGPIGTTFKIMGVLLCA